jgi:hypothetical protein
MEKMACVCKGTLLNGNPCRYKGKLDGYCNIHRPETECPICFDSTKDYHVLPCGHKFHEGCIKKWVATSICSNRTTCPVCRSVIPETASRKLDPSIDAICRVEEYFDMESTQELSGVPFGIRYSKCIQEILYRYAMSADVRWNVMHFLRKRMMTTKSAETEHAKLNEELGHIKSWVSDINNITNELFTSVSHQNAEQMLLHLSRLEHLMNWDEI